MYRTCIYCNRGLGSNPLVEHFPVGRCLAFDQEKGRLWVVCGRCRRWNLSPLEERWEAIEECERRFRDARRRYSTDNIGLARLREGVDLVRIGRPLRPEFAAWRYSREFIRRRAREILKGVVRGFLYTVTSFVTFPLFVISDENSQVIARVRDGEGNRLSVVRKDLKEFQLRRRDGAAGWSLLVPHRPRVRRRFRSARGKGERRIVELEGGPAIRAASHVLPWLNPFGGSSSQVKAAVTLIEQAGDAERLFRALPELSGTVRLTRIDPDTRLALEMAAQEEAERRAMEGELALLEEAWRQAEEIAGIADSLLEVAVRER